MLKHYNANEVANRIQRMMERAGKDKKIFLPPLAMKITPKVMQKNFNGSTFTYRATLATLQKTLENHGITMIEYMNGDLVFVNQKYIRERAGETALVRSVNPDTGKFYDDEEETPFLILKDELAEHEANQKRAMNEFRQYDQDRELKEKRRKLRDKLAKKHSGNRIPDRNRVPDNTHKGPTSRLTDLERRAVRSDTFGKRKHPKIQKVDERNLRNIASAAYDQKRKKKNAEKV